MVIRRSRADILPVSKRQIMAVGRVWLWDIALCRMLLCSTKLRMAVWCWDETIRYDQIRNIYISWKEKEEILTACWDSTWEIYFSLLLPCLSAAKLRSKTQSNSYSAPHRILNFYVFNVKPRAIHILFPIEYWISMCLMGNQYSLFPIVVATTNITVSPNCLNYLNLYEGREGLLSVTPPTA